MRHFITILSLIALSAAALFYEQVLAIFAGMTALQSLEMIVTYLLHIAVGTIAAMVVFGLPKIVAPWYRMFLRKQRAQRRGRVVVQQKAPTIRQPRLTVEQLLRLLAPNKTIQKAPAQPAQDESADLRL